MVERNLGLTYAFGPCRLDPARRILANAGYEIRIPERCSQLLVLLIQANGTIVDKETIVARLWSNCEPSGSNVSQHIYMLRQFLDQVVFDGHCVVTVRGKGYRLSVPARMVANDGAPAAVRDESPVVALLSSGLDTFEHYGLGCHSLELQTAVALNDAHAHFEEALNVDPDYVPALVGLARAYVALAEHWYMPGLHAYGRAKWAIMRTLSLDAKCAAAHAVLSKLSLFSDWNWVSAKQELDVAIDLDARSSVGRSISAWYHICLGAKERAISEMERALSAEPSSPALHLLLARIFLLSGDYAQAIKALSTLIAAGAAFDAARRYRAQAYILNGEPARAICDLGNGMLGHADDVAFRLPLLARAHAECGEVERAKEIYSALLAMARTGMVPEWNLALVAAGIERFDAALDHLERAMERREPELLTLRNSPWFTPLAPRLRFQSILKRLGLESQTPARPTEHGTIPRDIALSS